MSLVYSVSTIFDTSSNPINTLTSTGTVYFSTGPDSVVTTVNIPYAPSAVISSSITTSTTAASGTPTAPETGGTVLSMSQPASSGNGTGGTIGKHTGLDAGPAAGLAVGMLIAGALIATGILIMLQKKRNSKKKSRTAHGLAAYAPRGGQHEKPTTSVGVPSSQPTDFDLDRLLPQPLDDTTIKSNAQQLFSQIDAHVDSFYSDDKAGKSVQTTDGLLLDNGTRLFRIKQIIGQTMLESIGPNCSSEKSLLPSGFTSIARRLKEPDIHDHANTLSWSRLRTSFAYLIRPESSTEQSRLEQAIAANMQNLNAQLQPFEIAGSTEQRDQDLHAICETSASLGRMLLAQPAVWRFDWDVHARSGVTSTGLVYSPALVRLTDNKARIDRHPNQAMQAKVMR